MLGSGQHPNYNKKNVSEGNRAEVSEPHVGHGHGHGHGVFILATHFKGK
jgi:hypothetical protein